MADRQGRVVVIGAGFAGIAVARGLGKRGVAVTVVDRRNYHLFQPLLYQVATAALSPSDIANPIRGILGRYPSVDMLMDEPVAIDRAARTVHLGSGRVQGYDRLVVATGARDSYFGHDEWARHAPGLKSLEDAVSLRSRMLAAFERAELTTDEAERARLMTFVVIGGGPTGVEMAGAISELAKRTLRRDFRQIRPENARIVLIEAIDRVLAPFAEEHSRYAAEKLRDKGIELRLDAPVEQITAETVTFGGGETLAAGTMFWAAGVGASQVGSLLDVELAKGGRVPVTRSLHLADDPRVFVLGDLAAAVDEDGEPLPGLAQVAKQQGQHLARELHRTMVDGSDVAPFRYRSRGNTAIVGRNAAIYEAGRFALKGFPAWLLWAFVHVYLLIGFQNRLLVIIQWIGRYVTHQRSARLITVLPPKAGEGLPEQPVELQPAKAD